MTGRLTAQSIVAGVVGAPVRHSLSPLIHNAWIAAAGLDAAYVAFAVVDGRFEAFCDGLRGGAIRGVNVTAPFKETALDLADEVSPRALAAGSANLLTFEPDGRIFADSTDGEGLLRGLADQAAGFAAEAGPAVILGAGGAARAAAAALLQAGCPQVLLANRSSARAAQVAAFLGPGACAVDEALTGVDLAGAALVVNATPAGLGGGPGPVLDLRRLGARTVVMDMIYRPLRTALLQGAAARGLTTVDGLAMLIGQAVPGFARLFGREPPAIDVRGLAEASC